MATATFSERLQHVQGHLNLFQLASVYFIAIMALFLMTFRIWKFTIRPLFHPHEPKELPYWIPYIGHTFAYVRSGHDVILRAQKYFGNTREPFALQLKDRKMYFVLHPEDTTEVYRNTRTLSFDRVVQQLQRTFGISERTMTNAWTAPTSKEEDPIQRIAGVPNPAGKSLGDLSMDFWKMQLIGHEYRDLEAKFTQDIARILAGRLSDAEALNADISLLDLSREVLVGAGLRTFFGAKLLEMHPDFVAKYIAFDAESWKLWFKWPFSKSMYASKKAVEDALERWLEIPVEEREGMSFLVRTVEKTQRAIGTPISDLARIMNLLIFIINTNTYKATYWSVAHLITNPAIKTEVQRETRQAQIQTSKEQYFHHLREQSPRMTALFHEALRYYSASSSIRASLAPTPVGSKIIPAKSVVFVPFRPLHYDAGVFGPDVHSFNPDRFFNDKKLASNPSFKPFSGGSSYCPGRTLAKLEFAVFVTELLEKHHVEVLGKVEVPSVDEETPTKGIMMPKEGADVRLKIRRKSVPGGGSVGCI